MANFLYLPQKIRSPTKTTPPPFLGLGGLETEETFLQVLFKEAGALKSTSRARNSFLDFFVTMTIFCVNGRGVQHVFGPEAQRSTSGPYIIICGFPFILKQC